MRPVASLFVGLIAGCSVTAVYLALREPGPPDQPGPTTQAEPADSERNGGARISAPASFESSRAAYSDIADLQGAAELETLIDQAAAASRSAASDAALEALLLRLSAIDPRRAVDLAQDLSLDDGLLAQLFKAWADTAPDEALAGVSAMWPSMTQRSVALALLDVFGFDEAGIDRIAAVFSPDHANNFRVDAIGKLAERDLTGALALAGSDEIPAAVRTIAQQRIAQVMARIDPLAAFEQARNVTPTLYRRRYVNTLIDNWAKIDPEAALDLLETAELPELDLGPMSFRALAASSPERLLALAEQFDPATATYAQQAVVWALTALDPVAAYNRVSQLPRTGNIDRLVASIANRFARQSPDAALSWATSLEPRSPQVVDRVLATIAETDPVHAVDVAVAQILDPIAADSADMPSLLSLLSESLSNGAPELVVVMDSLASQTDPRVRQQLDQMLAIWPQADPDGALDWALRNTSALTRSTAAAFARALGSEEPALARQSLQQMPAKLRSAWLTGAAGGMAQDDLDGTLAWLDRYSNDPAYEDALIEASMRGASNDPETVARLIDERPALREQLAPRVASSWGASAPAAAERWVLDLPAGPVRDQSIQALLQGTSTSGEFNTDLLARLSSNEARQQAVLAALLGLGRTNPALGRRLIDEHISDPQMREIAESQLETGSNLPPELLRLLSQ